MDTIEVQRRPLWQTRHTVIRSIHNFSFSFHPQSDAIDATLRMWLFRYWVVARSDKVPPLPANFNIKFTTGVNSTHLGWYPVGIPGHGA